MSKSIYDADFTERLPEALTYDLKMTTLAAIVAVNLQEVSGLMQEVTLYERIDQLSERVLDILAYDFNVDMYDYSYPIETKRSVIKNSFKTSRIKGTKLATEQALRAVWADSEIEEWFEYGGEPYHFRVVCDASNEKVAAGNKSVSEAIRKRKRLSAHMDEIIFQHRIRCTVTTHEDNYKYSAPLTGQLAAGTHPQRNTRGGTAASAVIVKTGAEYFMFSVPQTGTAPQRNTIFREESGTLAGTVSAAGFKYKTNLCGSKWEL